MSIIVPSDAFPCDALLTEKLKALAFRAMEIPARTY